MSRISPYGPARVVREAIESYRFRDAMTEWAKSLEDAIIQRLSASGVDVIGSRVFVKFNPESPTKPYLKISGPLALLIDIEDVYRPARAHDTADYTPGGDDGR